MPLLMTKELTKRFGGVVAADNLNIKVEQQEVLSVIGPNGSGKSTFFNLITGIYRPSSGAIFHRDADIAGKKTYDIVNRGIARTFQATRLFNQLTVLQNVMMGLHRRISSGFSLAGTKASKIKLSDKNASEKAMEILEFTNLFHVCHRNAGNISGAEQRRLMIAIALCTDPELLLLDEPTAGVNAEEAQEILDLISRINQKQVAILLIEHNMKIAMKISKKMVVLNFGKMIAEGSPEEIASNEAVIEAYLGRD